VQVESRLDGSIAVRFRDHYLSIAECAPPKKPVAPVLKHPSKPKRSGASEAYRRGHEALIDAKTLPMWQAALIDRTRTR
jgi:hypothetical protein